MTRSGPLTALMMKVELGHGTEEVISVDLEHVFSSSPRMVSGGVVAVQAVEQVSDIGSGQPCPIPLEIRRMTGYDVDFCLNEFE